MEFEILKREANSNIEGIKNDNPCEYFSAGLEMLIKMSKMFVYNVEKGKNIKLFNTENQRQYSDKNVYNNIDQVLKNIIDEKN